MHYGISKRATLLTLGCLLALLAAHVRAGSGFILAQSQPNLFGGQEPTSMRIDLIPGSAENIVRAKGGKVIRVAIIGTDDVDVKSINPRTIRLEGVGVMLVGKSDKSLCNEQDINADSHLDLVCEVRTTGFMVGEGEFTIVLNAATYKGESLRGEDRIRIQPN